MSYVRRIRLDPTQVPTCPVELDTDHPLAQGLVGCWLLNGDYRDYSRSGFDGVPSGSPLIGGTARGPMSLFNGTNQFVSTGLYAPFNGSNLCTAAAWCQPATTSAKYMLLANDNPSGRGMSLTLNQDLGGNPLAGGFNFALYDGTNNTGIASSAGVFSANQFIHICGQRTSSTTAAIYLNGVSLSGATSQQNANISTTGGLCIGQRPYSGYNDYFSGSIGGAMVWDYALPPTLVLQSYLEPFAMLRPIQRRTWFVPGASPGPTTIVLASAALGVRGRAPELEAAMRGVGAPLGWRTSVPLMTSELTPATATWRWGADGIVVSSVLSAASRAWHWTAQGIENGANLIPLSSRVWGWGAHSMPVRTAFAPLARALRWNAAGVALAAGRVLSARSLVWVSAALSLVVRMRPVAQSWQWRSFGIGGIVSKVARPIACAWPGWPLSHLQVHQRAGAPQPAEREWVPDESEQ